MMINVLFGRCSLRFFPVKTHVDRTSSYPQDPNQIFNLIGINYPTPLSSIAKFEKQNDISINVYGLEFGENGAVEVVGPLHYTKAKKNRHVNLLYFKNGDRSHYCWIKNLSRLLASQLSRHCCKKWICDRCLQYFGTNTLLQKHEEDCKHFDAVKVELPDDDNKWLQFKNLMNKERHPFVVYADFDALTCPIDTCSPNPSTSYSQAYQQHEPCAVAFQVIISNLFSPYYINLFFLISGDMLVQRVFVVLRVPSRSTSSVLVHEPYEGCGGHHRRAL